MKYNQALQTIDTTKALKALDINYLRQGAGMIATVIVVLSIITLGVACYYYRTDETKAVGLKIYEFFRRHRYIRYGLIFFVVAWVFGTYLNQEEKKETTIKAVRIGYHKTGPVLEFEAPLVELLDPVVVWTGNEKDSRGVVFKFNGTVRESLVGGPFLTKTFGKLWPEKGKWAYFKGESKMIISEGARIKFDGPPYIVTIHTPKDEQTIRSPRRLCC